MSDFNGSRKQIRAYRSDQRTANVGDHTPIKREETHAKTCLITKELVDDDVVWSNPACPVEYRERGEDIPGEPVPYEAANHGVYEESLARHVSRILFTIVSVKGVKQRAVNQHARVDHRGWPDQELANEARKREANELRR